MDDVGWGVASLAVATGGTARAKAVGMGCVEGPAAVGAADGTEGTSVGLRVGIGPTAPPGEATVTDVSTGSFNSIHLASLPGRLSGEPPSPPLSDSLS